MDRYYEDVDFRPMNCRNRPPSHAANWNVGDTTGNYYGHRNSIMRKNDFGGPIHSFGGPTRGPNRGHYNFPTPPSANYQRYHYYNYNHDDRHQNYRAHNYQNMSGYYDARMPLNNSFPRPSPQQNYNNVFHKNNAQPTVNTKDKKKTVKQLSSIETTQKNPEAVKKAALAAELKKSLRKFQKNHSQNSNNLLVNDKSAEPNRSEAAPQPQPCFPWDLPLTVDDLKSIGRGKTGNIEACADSCSENELSSLERQNSLHSPKLTTESSIDTSPEILFVKQCRKRKVSESIEVGHKKKKLNSLQPRRRHRSASPNLCEGTAVEDLDGSSHQSYQENLIQMESRRGAMLHPTPNLETSPKSTSRPSLMQLLGVRRREFSEMVDQPRNPRVQFMLGLLMKRHKELLLQRTTRSRFSTMGGNFGLGCDTENSATNNVAMETLEMLDTPLRGMGASDTIDQLSKILLESSLTVDISSLPQELIDQLGNFLEMGADLGSLSEEISADSEVVLNTDEESNDFTQGVTNNGSLHSVTSGTSEKEGTTEENSPSQIEVKTEKVEDDTRVDREMNSSVENRVSPNSSSCLAEEEVDRSIKVGKCDKPSPLEEENVSQLNDTCSVEDDRNVFPEGDKSNIRNEERRDVFEVTIVDSPPEASPSDSGGVDETEENIFAKMWEIDQKIGKLMEEKQKLYERLKNIRSDKFKDNGVTPHSRDPHESSQDCASTQLTSKNSNSHRNTTTESSPRKTSQSENPQSRTVTAANHSSKDVSKKSTGKSSVKCKSKKLKKKAVQLNKTVLEIQSVSYSDAANTSLSSNSKGKGQNAIDQTSDELVEIVYDSSNPPDTVENGENEFVGHKDTILAIKLLGGYLYASCVDFCIYSFDLKTRKLVRKFQGHTKTVTSMFVHNMNECVHLYTGSHDRTLLKFNGKTGKLLGTKTIDAPITCMEEAWGILFIGTKQGSIERYNIVKSEFMTPAMDSLKSEVMAIQTSKEGPRRVLIIATRNKPIVIRDAYSGLLLRAINEEASQHIVFTIHVHHGLVYAGTSVYGLTAWDFTNGKCIKHYKNCGTIVSMKIVNGKIFAASYDGNIYIYDCKNSTPKHIIKATDRMLLCLAVRDNKIYAGSLDKKLRFWTIPR